MSPHETAVLKIVKEADGKIRREQVAQRLKSRLFPDSSRTAGVVKLADGALAALTTLGLVEECDPGVIRITTKGRLA